MLQTVNCARTNSRTRRLLALRLPLSAQFDPFNESASLWSFNYFFFNRKLKRIVCFTCMACSKRAGDNERMDDEEDVEADFFAMEDD